MLPKKDFTRNIKDFYKNGQKNIGDLGNLIVANDFEKLHKVQ